jgi:NADH:ubiquinone oxidoreductase subunit 5 (subunit L)/multisubunit Na+/H+ antiporter MnhA subunit
MLFFCTKSNINNFFLQTKILYLILSIIIILFVSFFLIQLSPFFELTKYENFMFLLVILFGMYIYANLLFICLYLIFQSIIFFQCIDDQEFHYFFLQFYLVSLLGLCIIYFIRIKINIFLNYMFLIQFISISILIYMFHIINKFLLYEYHYNIIFLMNFKYFYYEIILQFNFLSLSICYVVLFIGGFVKIFSLTYLAKESLKKLFFLYLSIFEFFMILVSISGDLFLLFIGWEGVGVMSFILISFWFTRTFAVFAGIKALLINKIGDFFLLVSFVLIIYFYKTTSISDFLILVTKNTFIVPVFIKDLILFFFVLAACVKSAQFGAHTWLLDAMEGPTPVSALLHAATMVTAGIIILLKFYILFYFVPSVSFFCIIIGSITMLFGSVCACFQYDIKKIIALSTCSQIGYMFASLGLLNFNGALFHLLTHSFFKALLFLCAGIIIFVSGGNQDIRKYGNYVMYLPQTFFCFVMANFSLLGFPYFSGFFSKDYMLVFAYSLNNIGSLVFLICSGLTISLTTFYSLRLLSYVFFQENNASKLIYNVLSDNYSYFFKISIFGLLGGSIFFGYFCESFVKTNNFFGFTVESSNIIVENYNNKLCFYIPLYCISLSIFFFFIMPDLKLTSNIFNFFSNNMYIDYIYTKISNTFLKFSWSLYKVIEKGLMELVFLQGFFSFFLNQYKLKLKSIEIINWNFVYKILIFLLFIYFLQINIFGSFSYFFLYLIINMLFFFFIL